MKTIILNSLSVLISISLTTWMFYSNRALQYWGKVTTCIITDCEFIEMEYEGRNKVITQEELGIAYKFDINGGTTVESKNTLNRENSYYLLEDYFFEEIDNDDEFFHSFYENPSAYLNGKKMKIRYLKSNPQKNILNLFYEEKNVWADIVLYSFTFLMILAVLLGITQTLSNNKQ